MEDKVVDVLEVLEAENPIGGYGNTSEDNFDNSELKEHTGIEGDEFELVDPELRNHSGNTKEDEMDEVADQYTEVVPTDFTDVVEGVDDLGDAPTAGQYLDTEAQASLYADIEVLRAGDDTGIAPFEGEAHITQEENEDIVGDGQDLSPDGEDVIGLVEGQFENSGDDECETLNGVCIEGDTAEAKYEEDLDNPEEAGEFDDEYEHDDCEDEYDDEYPDEANEYADDDSDDSDDSDDYEEDTDDEDDYEDDSDDDYDDEDEDEEEDEE